MSGSFDVPIRDDAAGTGSLKLENIDLGELSEGLMDGGTLRLEGRAAGTIKLRSPAAGEGERGATADVDLEAPSMKLQGIAAKKIKGTAGLPRRGAQVHADRRGPGRAVRGGRPVPAGRAQGPGQAAREEGPAEEGRRARPGPGQAPRDATVEALGPGRAQGVAGLSSTPTSAATSR